ncbi:Six-hairpin glycosidase [Piromyces finnis]|uniref:Six-hairpin glycosidase n=1 Tax=Piromyces finnis TaxID=1754191 RepID=A0A1Y1VE81_9FUNG|nr:Six-hairpin glycosidase [Piromyces finnis]|eukprot:ORX53276.1 Six-hairpin glycosidase [Piromyces finnis]
MYYTKVVQLLVTVGFVSAQWDWGNQWNWGNQWGNNGGNQMDPWGGNNGGNNNNNNGGYDDDTYVEREKVTPTQFFDENGAYFGPDCDSTNYSGAYYTGDYTSPFKTYLGKTDEEIQKKLDELWNHYFKGDNNSKVFYDQGNEGYILDVNNNDVRSEGMSYGMMIAVQTDHQKEFDKLWNWAKNHMWHKSGSWDGYFAWKRGSNGSGGDDNCAPDGEMYFMMSLLFAANRWNDKKYMDDAQYILKRMWDNSQHSLFNPAYNVITFQPQGNENNFSDPSYDLPAFVDLFSRWSTTNQNKWKAAASATRDHLYKSSNPQSGLFSDYNNFDGTPHSVSYNSNAQKYMYDAMRCAMNFGMDYYLFGTDAKRQTEMAKRIINHFEKDGYQHARFNWDGTGGSEQYTLGETGANAVATYALMGIAGYEDIIKKNLKMAWDGKPMTGQYRYYDGLVHYLSMLHLLGSFKIWKPAPSVQQKEISQTTVNGVTYKNGDVIDLFENCKLYKATINAGSSSQGTTPSNPSTGKCSSKITSQGYQCCSDNCEVIYTDADGNWGVENGEWCGCAKATSCIGAQGYPCCQSSTEVYFEDSDGKWSVENNDWCIIRN